MSHDGYRVKGYLPTIGIECHVQLKTKTKLFSGVSNDARDAEPNSVISHICLGLPGALPYVNAAAVDLASRAAFALNTTPQLYSKFDRKHYFYPDLPKGYQITQYDEPIILGGYVTISDNGQKKKIGITRAHLEEDAGKNTHPAGKDYSLVDLNRAGTPLLEIVSEPEIHSATQAKAYAKELYLLMRYAGVTEGDLYHGNMRFDVNVSVSKDSQLGVRTETKNLNSFKSVERAVLFEIDRQIEVLENQGVIDQETRGWDDAKQKTVSQRSKEEAHDYRYFPEPDIPPLALTKEYVESIEKQMPDLPHTLRKKMHAQGLSPEVTETLLNTVEICRLLEAVMSETDDKATVRRVANWLSGELVALLSENGLRPESLQLTSAELISLNDLVVKGTISSSAAKQILREMAMSGGEALSIAKQRDLLQTSNESHLAAVIKQVISNHPQALTDIKSGEQKALGFLVGQVMKETKGKANPQLVNKLLREITKQP